MTTDALNDHLKVSPAAVHRLSRELWLFDRNDPLFSRLP